MHRAFGPELQGEPLAQSRQAAEERAEDVAVDRLLDVLYRVGTGLGAFALAASLVRGLGTGWRVEHAAYALLYGTVLTGLFAGRRIPRAARTAILLGPMGVSGLADAYPSPSDGSGLLVLSACCVLTAVLAGRRIALMVVVFGTALLIATGAAASAGATGGGFESWLRGVNDWTGLGLGFLVLTLVPAFSATALPAALGRTVAKLRQRTTELEQANAELADDVEHQRQVERDLTQREARYRFLAESTRDVIFTHDMDLRITYVSPSAAVLFGYDLEELQSKSIDRLLAPGSLAKATAAFAERAAAAAGGDPSVPLMEYEYVRKDGSTFWGEMHVSFVLDEQGAPCGVQGTLRDVTDRHQAELEKQALEQQLRQSEKLRSIGELAGGIAHDFNNQLSGILGYVDLLRLERGDDPRLVEYANNIAAPAKRAADLTAKLLAFARKGQFQPEPLDVHAVIREAVSVLQRSIAKTIHLRLELEATRSVVVGDATQLQNALLNIALNARDAMPEGGELIIRTELRRVSAAAVPTGADVAEPRLLILLSDTGMGMSEETQQRVFEPFFTTKPLGQGTGMGLAAVHGIVRKHGGGVKVDSALGRGTTFSITLPLAPEDTVAARRSGQYPAVRGAGRVLVVDDEDIVCSMVARMLRRLGYDPLTREVARDAIRLYRDQWRTIDLVLLDLVLPKMSGKRVFEAIRAVNPQARVILVSGYSAEGEARELLDAGALGFLQKPFTATQLSQSVADALSVELAPPVQRRVPLRSGAVPAQPDVPFDSDAATASDRRR